VEVHRLDGWVSHLRRFAAGPEHQYHPTFRDPRLVARLTALIDRLRPDVIHAHGWMLYSVLPVRLPAGTALVVGLHDFSAICNNKTLLRKGVVCDGPAPVKCTLCAAHTYGPVKGVPLAVGLLGKSAPHRRVHRFIANSRYVADVTAAWSGVPPDRFDVVPPPVADDIVTADRPRPPFLPSGDFILFAGAMGPHKGLGVLLDAHAMLSARVPLVILGVPRADSPDCDRPNVTVRRNVAHADVLASWGAATVGAVPSICAEAFGLSAVEGMAGGTAMVVSAVGGLQEVVEAGVTGLVVPPGDTRALASGLDELLRDPARRAVMAAAGRESVLQYTVSAVLPQVERVYAHAQAGARGADDPARPA
jgi:glycosyltransferase involved in cell wall biosynthesis